MGRFTHSLLCLAMLGATVGAWAAESLSTALGSAGFRATPERPFGWRGDGSGRFPGATPVTEWSPTKNVRWNALVGRSYSSPILTEEFVFVTSEPNLLLCIRRNDGTVQWKLPLTPALLSDPKSRKAAESYQLPKDGSGMMAATPVTDGRDIFVVLANGIVCAVDLNGKPKWATCIEGESTTGYGRSASPLLLAGKLIVHMSQLYAFDAATGKQLWVNMEAKSSYGTPAVVKAGGTDLIVTSLGELVRASDGKSVNSGIGRTAHSSPILCGEGMVCFGDNNVSAIHLDAMFKAEEVWNGMIGGDVVGSPLWHDKTLFISTGDGQLFAFDAGGRDAQDPLISDRKLFETNNPAGPTTYSSPTLGGRYLFMTSNHGEAAVLEAAREAKLVARNKLMSGTGSTPVFSGTEMFLRDGERLFCIGN
jgi:outer membrane protein assembly factor BamB